MSIFTYCCYAPDVYLGRGSIANLPLDAVSNAGCINQETQRKLSQFAPFALDAYKTLNDRSHFESKLLPERKVSVVDRSAWTKTKACWKKHVDDLKRFHIITITTTALLVVTTYFAVAKSCGTLARTIFSGRQLSGCFVRPGGVNLPQLPFVLSLAASILAKCNAVYVLTGDVRHYFHAIALGSEIKDFFTIFICNTLYHFNVLPMGWSFSPRIAQCMAWSALLSLATDQNGLKLAAEKLRHSAHPPSFVVLHTPCGQEIGILFIWYDNFVCVCGCRDIATALSLTMTEMTNSFNFHWGQKSLAHPVHLRKLAASTMETIDKLSEDVKLNPLDTDSSEALAFYSKEATAIGIQFGMTMKRGRDITHPTVLQWRIKPRTIEKARTLFDMISLSSSLELSCRVVAGICGVCVWRIYISGEPLVMIHDVISLSAKAGRHARVSGWTSNISLNTHELDQAKAALTLVLRNEWHTIRPFIPQQNKIIVASDASLRMGAWTVISSGDSRSAWKNWFWCPSEDDSSGCDSSEIIFLLELRAAERAILHHSRPDSTLILLIDNTAAASCLRRWYSGHPEGRKIVQRVWEHLNNINCNILVVGIASEDNDADSPTRGCRTSPNFDSRRLMNSYLAACNALAGCERQRLNSNLMCTSHQEDFTYEESGFSPGETDSVTSDDCGDAACDNISNIVNYLEKETTF